MKNAIHRSKVLFCFLFFLAPLTLGFSKASAQLNGQLSPVVEMAFSNNKVKVQGQGSSFLSDYAEENAKADAKSNLQSACNADYLVQKANFEQALISLGIDFFILGEKPYESQSVTEPFFATVKQNPVLAWYEVSGFYWGRYVRRVQYVISAPASLGIQVLDIPLSGNPVLSLGQSDIVPSFSQAVNQATVRAEQNFQKACWFDYLAKKSTFEAVLTNQGYSFFVLEELPYDEIWDSKIFYPLIPISTNQHYFIFWQIDGHLKGSYKRKVRYLIIK